MLRILMFAAIVSGIAMAVPNVIDGSLFSSNTPNSKSVSKSAPVNSKTVSYSGRKVVLTADNRGHFLGSFQINGRKVDGLIDTGASAIAINRTTARKLGLSVTPAMFKYQVSTANGTIRAARVILKTVKLKTIRVRNVDAYVLDDASLPGTLIGMSFLSRIGSFQAKDGKLILTKQ